MSVKFMRKTAVAVAATALLGGGLTVGIGQGVAGAAPAAECVSSSSKDFKIGNRSGHFTLTQTVSEEVAPGGLLTITSSVKDDGLRVDLKRLRVNVPEGSTLVSFERDGKDVTKAALENDPEPGAFSSDGTTSTATRGGVVSYKVVVRVPESLKPGSTFNVGGGFSVAWAVAPNQHNMNDTGACVRVRPKNPVEAAFGSADGLGLGSIEDGVGGVTGSVTDPTGSIADVVNQIDMGKIIGGIIGGAVGS